MNESITYEVLQAVIDCRTTEFILCAGSRNVSFVEALSREERLTTYYCPEERSAAYFALGRSRLTQRPTAVITTSGSAAAELLPAAIEAYYSGVPLILITADRPRSFRGSGAPQAAEQVGLFGHYAQIALDIGPEDKCTLSSWNRRGPIHLNVCLEEHQSQPKFQGKQLSINTSYFYSTEREKAASHLQNGNEMLNRFFEQTEKPLVIVSTLNPNEQETAAQFLMHLNAPVLLEGVSGLREDPRLKHLHVHGREQLLQNSHEMGYSVDGVLRIGGVPTHRVWRDLESFKNRIKVCSLSFLPFSGLSWSRAVIEFPIDKFLAQYQIPRQYESTAVEPWFELEKLCQQKLIALFNEEPAAEPSLVHFLSNLIPPHSHVYLGNSLPIREWDLAATSKQNHFRVRANRGINGIDGQISTFLGLSSPERENWALIGDLTTLYDMAGFWIHQQLPSMQITVVVINNGGGQIFSRLFESKKMLNEHTLSFEPLANMWGFSYQRLEQIPAQLMEESARFLEIVPDVHATKRFWEKFSRLNQSILLVS
jgi:2-succinyl-5-enolpyruvyl-6-hydroxy-3-cyclohexene-1-carboxylate synthase